MAEISSTGTPLPPRPAPQQPNFGSFKNAFTAGGTGGNELFKVMSDAFGLGAGGQKAPPVDLGQLFGTGGALMPTGTFSFGPSTPRAPIAPPAPEKPPETFARPEGRFFGSGHQTLESYNDQIAFDDAVRGGVPLPPRGQVKDRFDLLKFR